MKSLLTTLLCLGIVFTPMQRPKATLLPFCIAVFAVAVAGGVAVWISSCGPKYYCSTSEEAPEPICRIISIQERKAGEYKILSGPYRDAALCDANCGTNAPTSTSISAASATDIVITIERSYDLKTWVVAGTTVGSPYSFEWGETNAVFQQCYYRARY